MSEIGDFRSNYNNCISVYIPDILSNDDAIYNLKCEQKNYTNECIISMIDDIIDLVQTHMTNTSIIIFMHPTRFYGLTNHKINSYKFIIDDHFHEDY